MRSIPWKLILVGPPHTVCGAALAMCRLYFFLLLSNKSDLGYCLDFMTAGTSVLLQEYALDADMARFGLLTTMPVFFCVTLVRYSYLF